MKNTTLIILAVISALASPRLLIYFLDLYPNEPTPKTKSRSEIKAPDIKRRSENLDKEKPKGRVVESENHQTPALAIKETRLPDHSFVLESLPDQEFIGDRNAEDALHQTDDTPGQSMDTFDYAIDTQGLTIESNAEPITEQDRRIRRRNVKKHFSNLRGLPLELKQADFFTYVD